MWTQGTCGESKVLSHKTTDDDRDRVTNATPPESSESTASGEVQISQTSVRFTDYGHPPDSHTPNEPSQPGIKMEGGDIPEEKELILESGSIQIYRS